MESWLFFYCSTKADKNNDKTTARNAYDITLRSLLAQASIFVDGRSIFSKCHRWFDLTDVVSCVVCNICWPMCQDA
jgi:hypothetical protein